MNALSASGSSGQHYRTFAPDDITRPLLLTVDKNLDETDVFFCKPKRFEKFGHCCSLGTGGIELSFTTRFGEHA